MKLHDFCHNPKYKCQKQITLTPRQFQREGGSNKNNSNHFSKEHRMLGRNF